MLKFLKLLFYIKLVHSMDTACFEKHYLPVNDEHFTILTRNMTEILGINCDISPKSATLQNNGQTLIIKYFFGKANAIIRGGPYGDDKYKFEFMYFNWLKENRTSVEALPIELHLVFANRKYGTYEKAVKKNFGITVFSFRYTLREDDNSLADIYGTQEIYKSFERIQQPNTEIKLYHSETFISPIYGLIDFRSQYYVYQGRLLSTLHLCSADVIWIEFPNSIKINKSQLQSFQKLLASDMKPMLSKFHDVVAPNGPIYKNVDLYRYEGPPLPAFEHFNETSNDNFAIRNKGSLLILIITTFELLISMF